MSKAWHTLGFAPGPATSRIGPTREDPPCTFDHMVRRDAEESARHMYIRIEGGGIAPVAAGEAHPGLDLFAPEDHSIIHR